MPLANSAPHPRASQPDTAPDRAVGYLTVDHDENDLYDAAVQAAEGPSGRTGQEGVEVAAIEPCGTLLDKTSRTLAH